ncbi:methyl-accepting chemotaxis protein [Saccharopolyspora lacisalsi]|uniref:Methyl-accepting chemotaxis protein n=1 Tax=Halosaccharopolyspora lacisalsi TaxID=1000566 RepID=A0A839E0L5_9PSEU|nr:hypothetical protein [Halosaccharopolyspora lacisalsi]MBA8826640.1 methyl-accepting chemotaxis protein [Halosaccharopolyspora lacisalsi]
MTSAGDGIETDHEKLRSMASDLRSSTDKLTKAAQAVPPAPKVSTSAEQVGHTLSEITKTAAGLIAGLEDTAGKIDASDGSYGQVDNTNADDLQRQAEDLGPD